MTHSECSKSLNGSVAKKGILDHFPRGMAQGWEARGGGSPLGFTPAPWLTWDHSVPLQACSPPRTEGNRPSQTASAAAALWEVRSRFLSSPCRAHPAGCPGEGRQVQLGAGPLLREPVWRKALSRHSEPQPPALLLHYSSPREAPLPLPDPGPAWRNAFAPPPAMIPHLSWKLLSKKVVKMIKCEQIFSSFSTLIKNVLLV